MDLNYALAHLQDDPASDVVGIQHHDFSGMGWFGMGLGILFWILVFVLVVLFIVAMVKYIFEDKKESKNKVYVCKECGYEYEDKIWAEKCENWCREHKSCNLDIIKHGKPGK